MFRLRYIIIICVVSLFVSCGGRRSSLAFSDGDTIRLTYATNLRMVEHDGYTEVSMLNPKDSSKVLNTYLLVARDHSLPEPMPHGVVVRTPVTNAVVFSAVYCGLMTDLRCDGLIGGVCDLQYIHQKKLNDRYRQGKLADCGNAMTPDMEKIINLNPDLIMMSFYENSHGYGKFEQLGIPVIECADYLETSAMGRAEWMKFYGRLFGRGAEADSIFAGVEKNYNALQKQAHNTKSRPKVLSDTRYGQTWYMPGTNSTMGRMYMDAGGSLPVKDLQQKGSVPFSTEQVFDKARDAAIWLIKYNQPTDKTLASLKAEDPLYDKFSAFAKGSVYGCNTSYSLFYEETPFHPDWLLSDLVQIIHPELGQNNKLRYFCKLKAK